MNNSTSTETGSGLVRPSTYSEKRGLTRVSRMPAEPVPVEAVDIVQPDRITTDEDRAYSLMVEKNPLIEKLVERFDLIGSETGSKPVKVEHPEAVKSQQEKKTVPTPGDRMTLIGIALRILTTQNNYTKEDIIALLQADTKVNSERAENGFNLMLRAEVIEETTAKGRYNLKGTIPF